VAKFEPRCLYNKVKYFRGFCGLARGRANVEQSSI
jgi:hypothetical protein